jgi:uncharacterized protein YqjF (DUF2071 family)
MARKFLEAEWRKLAMANYAVDPALLKKYLPYKTEIDLWNNTCYVSLVGFMFLNTRLLGFQIPFHSDFEEVNLRFYVRFLQDGEWKRGVVFIKEIVPKPALTFIANTVYTEKYETMPMRHAWTTTDDQMVVEYAWKKRSWNSFKVTAENKSCLVQKDSEEEFITEHYWGYTQLTSTKTSEYGVEHPTWQVYRAIDSQIDVDFMDVYGSDFAFLKNEKPKSVFLAEGSPIVVKSGRIIR